jgi:hypothetical protein
MAQLVALTFVQAAEHVGDHVRYTSAPGMPARPGVIRAVKQLVVVDFNDHDGGMLQCNPHCLDLVDSQLF